MVMSLLYRVWDWVSAFTLQRNEKVLNVYVSISSPTFRIPSKWPSTSKSTTPTPIPVVSGTGSSTPLSPQSESDSSYVSSLTASIGEQLLTNYDVHELPGASTVAESDKRIVNTGMLARIEYLDTKLDRLKLTNEEKPHFRLEQIANDDDLIRFYAGFLSYDVFVAVFEFLGPSVNRLHYWGTSATADYRKKKLDPRSQFFLTLVGLRLNLRVKDLSVRFSISSSLVSRLVITWICFLYQHFN